MTMNNLINKSKITLCSSLIVFMLAFSAPNTSNAGGGGGGGGGVVQLATTLIGILLFAEAFLPGKEFSTGDRFTATAQVAALNFFLGNIWLNPTKNSVWQITAYTMQLRLFMEVVKYYQTYRYLRVRREIERSFNPYGVVNHPNALNNFATIEILTQYDLQTGGKVRKQIQEYKQLQSIMAVLNLILLYNPYSLNYIYQRGNSADIDINYRPSYIPSPVDTVTLIYLNSIITNYIEVIRGENTDSNVILRSRLSAGIAIALLNYLMLYASIMSGL